jgi:hypothetical protein
MIDILPQNTQHQIPNQCPADILDSPIALAVCLIA